MAGRCVLALDLGTSGARCLAIDRRGSILSLASAALAYDTPEDCSALARELQPEQLWSTLCGLVRQSLSGGSLRPSDVACLAITSQRQGSAFLDGQGRELYLGPNLDLRAVFEGAAMDQEHGKDIYGVTGHLPSFFFPPSKLRWFQIHQPETFERIACVLTIGGWIAYRLTGELADEHALRGEAGLLDVRLREPATGLLQRLGFLPLTDTPTLVTAGNVVGDVCPLPAEQCGLLPGTPVVLAGPDTQCGLLGMGVATPGQVGIMAGWSTPLQMVTDKPVFDPRRRIWTGCHVVPDRWVLESNAGDGGNAYSWLGGLTGRSYKEAEGLAQDTPRGAEGVMAFLGAGPMDMRRLGLGIGGLFMPVPMTFQKTGAGHMARATLESIAFAVRANLEQLERIARMPAATISLGGGMTQSNTFVQALADVLKRTVYVFSGPVSARGAALCGWTAVGAYQSLDEAAAEVTHNGRTVEPDPLGAIEYQELYVSWLKQYHKLRKDPVP